MDAALTAVSRSTSGETAKLAIEWVAVTACRSGEARGATWAEIDEDTATWEIPAARMKAARPHRVPLSAAALDVLRRGRAFKTGDDGLVFLSPRGKVLSDVTLARIFRDLGIAGTIHGLRSTFRDWCAEQGIDHVVAEMALAHSVGTATERAYRRSDLVEAGRAVMQRWGDVVRPEPFTTP